jgi:integrase
VKGSVQQRWKAAEGGQPDCRHEWGEEVKKAQTCSLCGARRARAETWTFQHEVTRNGKRAFVTGTRRTKAEAQKALTESLSLYAKGEQVEPSKVTVAAYLRDWLELCRPRLKAGTWRSYHDIVEHRLVPQIGDERLAELRPAAIARCYAILRASGRTDGRGGLSETSLEHTHRTLHAALEHAAKSRLVGRNVADDVVKPKRGRPELTTWSAEELAAFLAATASNRLHPLFFTAATTAMRRGELLGLRWADVDLDAARASIRRSRTSVGYEVVEDTPKSRRSVRTVDLDPQTVAVLRRWSTAQKAERLAWGAGWVDSALLFTREDGSGLHPDCVGDAFERAVKGSALPRIRLHDLRHTWATLALRAGVSPKIVSERLGHASVGFTLDTYAHAVPGWQAEAAATVAGLVFGSGLS